MTDIAALIFEVIDDVNGQLPIADKMEKLPETVIVGEEGVLDSLGVINFLVSLEEKIVAGTGQSVSLLREELLNSEDGTLHTVANIERYIMKNLI